MKRKAPESGEVSGVACRLMFSHFKGDAVSTEFLHEPDYGLFIHRCEWLYVHRWQWLSRRHRRMLTESHPSVP